MFCTRILAVIEASWMQLPDAKPSQLHSARPCESSRRDMRATACRSGGRRRPDMGSWRLVEVDGGPVTALWRLSARPLDFSGKHLPL